MSGCEKTYTELSDRFLELNGITKKDIESQNEDNYFIEEESDIMQEDSSTIIEHNDIHYEKDLNLLAGVGTEDIEQLREESSDRYYYNKLSEEEQYIYLEILSIILNMDKDIAISTTDEDLSNRIFKYVQNDYPEIFYIDGYTYTRYIVGDMVKRLTISGDYIMDAKTRDEYLPKIADYVSLYISELNNALLSDYDDYDVIKFTYEYIINNTEYVIDAPYNQSILSVMCEHQSVCQGYAKAFQYLLNQVGVECTIVTGAIVDGEGHAWNVVKSDGNYYYVDATWGDASYSITAEDEDLLSSIPPVNYDFLLVNQVDISQTHIFDDIDIMPICDSVEDNYYVREGRYFTSVDKELIKKAFDRAYEEQEEYITIKMSEDVVYNEMWTYLLKEQHIFEYLSGLKSVSYAENIEQRYMVFWI